jgi:hypothetical protein
MSPAMAQSRFASDFQPAAGATATVNLRVPLGAVPTKQRKTTYGLTLGFGRQTDSVMADGRLAMREARIADIRFSGNFKLQRAEALTFDLTNLKNDPRLMMGEGKGKETTWLWVAAGLGIGLGICWAAGCFDDNDHHDELSD